MPPTERTSAGAGSARLPSGRIASVLLLLVAGAGAAGAVAGLFLGFGAERRLSPAVAPPAGQDPLLPFPLGPEGLVPSAVQAMGIATAMEALGLLALCVFLVGVGSASILAAQAVSSRRRDRAVRGLIGAPPWRLFGRGVAGAVTLGTIGGALAFGLGLAAGRALLARWPGELAGSLPDPVLPLLVAGSGALIVSIFVLVPTLRVFRAGWLGDALAPQARTNPGLDEEVVHTILTVAQTMLGVTTLYAAALLVLAQGFEGGPGTLPFEGTQIEVGELLIVEVEALDEEVENRIARYRTFAEEVRGLPLVIDSGLAGRGALGGRGSLDWITVAVGGQLIGTHAEHHAVTDDWLRTLGAPLEGQAPATGEVVMNATLARFANWAGPETGAARAMRLAGPLAIPKQAAGRLRTDLPPAAPGWGRSFVRFPLGPGSFMQSLDPPVVYLSFEEYPPARAELLIRVDRGFAAIGELGPAVRRAATEAGLGVATIQSVAHRLEEMGAARGWFGGVAALLGAAALLLAVVGVGGVFRVGTERRIAELGVRRAMGGSRTRVAVGVLGELARPLAVGGGLGFGTAVAAGHELTALLPSGPLVDLWLYLGALGAIALGALVGALGPVLRATSLEPASAIARGEEVDGGGLA